MRAPFLLAAAILLAVPAWAQDGTGARIAPGRQDAARARTPLPPLGDSVEDPATLLRLAEAALSARRTREASDLLERAEARLLTRSELASEADRPAVGGAIGELAAARDAIGRRDPAGAQGLVASALRRIEAGEAPAVVALPSTPMPTRPVPPVMASPALPLPPIPPATGSGPVPGPAWGGGARPLPGIAPQDMPVGGTASPPVPVGPDSEAIKTPLPAGAIPPASTKPPPA